MYASTLEANAALRSIVHRATHEEYEDFLIRLAKESGIETPTREDLAKLDRKRKNKGSNKDWQHPHDPDARLTKMKDGRTHLAHKIEHAVDMDTGVVLGVTIQGADQGDTTTGKKTLEVSIDEVKKLAEHEDPEVSDSLATKRIEEGIFDKGYHSNDMVLYLQDMQIRTYVSEPDRGRRNWKNKTEERDAVYANRRGIRGKRGKRLLRRRGELVERPFAHMLETGGMRRTHLREQENIRKRLLIRKRPPRPLKIWLKVGPVCDYAATPVSPGALSALWAASQFAGSSLRRAAGAVLEPGSRLRMSRR